MARRRFTARTPAGYAVGTRAHTSLRRAYTPSPRRSYGSYDDTSYISKPTPHYYDPSPEYLMADNLANRTIENTTYAAYDADDLHRRSRGKDKQLLSHINYAVANAAPSAISSRASVSRRAVRGVSTPAPVLQSSPSTVLSQTLDRSEVSRPRASVPYMYSRRVVAPIFDVAPVDDSTALLPYYSSPVSRRAIGARAQVGLKRDIRAQSAAPAFAYSQVSAAELSPYYKLGSALDKLPTERLTASRRPQQSTLYPYAPYLSPSHPYSWDVEPITYRSPSRMYGSYSSPLRHAISVDQHRYKPRASIPYAKATQPGKYYYPSAAFIVQKARREVIAPPEDYSAAGIRFNTGLSGRQVYTMPYSSIYGEKMRSLPRQRAAAFRTKSEAKAYSPLEGFHQRPVYTLKRGRRGPRYTVIQYLSGGNAEAAVIAPRVEIDRRHKEPRSRFAQDKIRSFRLEPKDDYGTPAPDRLTGGLHSSAPTSRYETGRYRRY